MTMSPTRYNSDVGCGIGPALRQPIRIEWMKLLLMDGTYSERDLTSQQLCSVQATIRAARSGTA